MKTLHDTFWRCPKNFFGDNLVLTFSSMNDFKYYARRMVMDNNYQIIRLARS